VCGFRYKITVCGCIAQILPWHSLSVCHVHIQVIQLYTVVTVKWLNGSSIRADFHNGDRQPCKRWESTFPKMRDCPSDLHGAKYYVFAFACQKCAYVHRSTYVLAYQSTVSSIRFHILLFVFSRRSGIDVQSADDGIHIDVALLPIRCCIVVVSWYFQN